MSNQVLKHNFKSFREYRIKHPQDKTIKENLQRSQENIRVPKSSSNFTSKLISKGVIDTNKTHNAKMINEAKLSKVFSQKHSQSKTVGPHIDKSILKYFKNHDLNSVGSKVFPKCF